VVEALFSNPWRNKAARAPDIRKLAPHRRVDVRQRRRVLQRRLGRSLQPCDVA
jgi:hypothetical protein